jgi:DNA repair protein RadC
VKIKDIPERSRPRERLKEQGVEALSDAELLAIVLQKGVPNENVIDMSNRLISKYGLHKLYDCTLEELQEIKGIGFAKACQILVLFEFSKRINLLRIDSKKIMSGKDAYAIGVEYLGTSTKEKFMALYLDPKYNLISKEIISFGDVESTSMHPREVFRGAIKTNAVSVIIVHNHPSNDPTPSQEDKEITNRLEESGKIIGIDVLDHIIVCRDRYYSFKDKKITEKDTIKKRGDG